MEWGEGKEVVIGVEIGEFEVAEGDAVGEMEVVHVLDGSDELEGKKLAEGRKVNQAAVSVRIPREGEALEGGSR